MVNALGVVVAMLAGGTAVAAPPSCSAVRTALAVTRDGVDMRQACDDVFIEPEIPVSEIDGLLRSRDVARANVARVLGAPLQNTALTLFCKTEACKLAFGAAPGTAGGAGGFSRDEVPTKHGVVTRTIIVVTSWATDVDRLITHELVHAEMKAYAPYDASPTWFNEGVATYVAGNPRCAGIDRTGFDVTRLATKPLWQAHVGSGRSATLEAYCAAGAEVGRWAHGWGNDAAFSVALKDLLRGVNGGIAFDRIFVRDG